MSSVNKINLFARFEKGTHDLMGGLKGGHRKGRKVYTEKKHYSKYPCLLLTCQSVEKKPIKLYCCVFGSRKYCPGNSVACCTPSEVGVVGLATILLIICNTKWCQKQDMRDAWVSSLQNMACAHLMSEMRRLSSTRLQKKSNNSSVSLGK